MEYYANIGSVRSQISMDGIEEEGEEKDETKRKSRNLSEKKRRDEFNRLVTELGTMVSPNNRKMDKTTVLKTTIGFLKQHTEMSIRSKAEEIQTNWKPMFLSNEEFSHLMLEAIDGFIIVLGTDGQILYTSESMASLLGYMPTSLNNSTLYEIVSDNDKIPLYNTLNMSGSVDTNGDQQLKLLIHIRRSDLSMNSENNITELVELSGYFRKWTNPAAPVDTTDFYLSDDEDKVSLKTGVSPVPETQSQNPFRLPQSDKTVFVATGRLATPQLLREMPVVHQSQSEFTSKHSLEWKFLFVDHRAPPIIGYLTFELLGTSGYDYYHVDDLDLVANCHEAVMQTGEGTTCYYRFLTKGQQWIWLQTRYYITYHMWNSKPEFINATHKVVNYKEVLNQANKTEQDAPDESEKTQSMKNYSFRSGSPTWSSKSSICGSDRTGFASSSRMSQETTSVSQEPLQIHSGTYRQSRLTNISGSSAMVGNTIDTVGEVRERPVSEMSCEDIVTRTDDETQSVASSQHTPKERGEQSSPAGWSLTPAQRALQLQLKTKHAELSKRIAQQQAELKQLGEQLLLTHSGPESNSQQGLTLQQQQQSRQLQQQIVHQQTPLPSPQESPQHMLQHVSPQVVHQQSPQHIQQRPQQQLVQNQGMGLSQPQQNISVVYRNNLQPSLKPPPYS